MTNPFFDHPILDSPYESPVRHWDRATSTGWFSTATGRANSAVSRNRTPRCAPAKNHGLGLPDFIVLVDDGHGDDDLLHLVVEIKGYRRVRQDTYWVSGVNHLGTYGRWAFTEMYQMEAEFKARVKSEFNKMIKGGAHEN